MGRVRGQDFRSLLSAASVMIIKHTHGVGIGDHQRRRIIVDLPTQVIKIDAAVRLLDCDNLLLMHCTSTYPCDPSELNLRMIQTLRDRFPCAVGF